MVLSDRYRITQEKFQYHGGEICMTFSALDLHQKSTFSRKKSYFRQRHERVTHTRESISNHEIINYEIKKHQGDHQTESSLINHWILNRNHKTQCLTKQQIMLIMKSLITKIQESLNNHRIANQEIINSKKREN